MTKRKATSVPASVKRPKLDWNAVFENPKNKQRATDILNARVGPGQAAFLSVEICANWPLKRGDHSKLHVFSTQDGGTKIKLQIVFGVNCVNRLLDTFPVLFLVGDEVHFSLEGVTVELPDPTSASNPFRGTLKFPDHVIFKFGARVGVNPKAKLLFNTWDDSLDQDWYASSDDDAMTIDESPLAKEKIKRKRKKRAPSSTSNMGNKSATSLDPVLIQEKAPGLGKRERKRLEKEARKAKFAHEGQAAFATSSSSTLAPSPVPLPLPVPRVPQLASPPSLSDNQDASTLAESISTSSHAVKIDSSNHEGANSLVFGLCGLKVGPSRQYVQLSDMDSHERIRDLIGILGSYRTPTRTATGDFSCTMEIFDPSINFYEPGNTFQSPHTHIVTCFAARMEDLPEQIHQFDIVLLRNLKKGNKGYNHNSIGYKDRLQWSVFNSKAALRLKAEGKNVMDLFLSAPSSPMEFKPEPAEMQYCLRLARWWEKVELQKVKDEEHVQYVGGADNQTQSSAYKFKHAQREYRRIEDVGPEKPPNGYFNCVVEAMHKYETNSSTCTLHVSDYTANSRCHEITNSSWCPPSLSRHIFQITMWDSAAVFAKEMEMHCYYALENCRAFISNHGRGSLEGKISEVKIRKLKEEDATRNPHLKELLDRKRTLLESGELKPQHVFAEKRLKDSDIEEHFTCFVEILHIKVSLSGATFIFVTDYTRPQFLIEQMMADKMEWSGHSWARDLDGYILKVELEDGQALKAKQMKAGELWQIKNLMLKKINTKGTIRGALGGDHPLLAKIPEDGEKNSPEGVQALKRNRDTWKDGISKVEAKERQVGVVARKSGSETKKPSSKLTFARLPSPRGVGKADGCLRARLTKIRPPKPEAWFIRSCRTCKIEIMEPHAWCPECHDEEKIALQYRLHFTAEFEDCDGQKGTLTVHDQVPWLRGMFDLSTRKDLDKIVEKVLPLTGLDVFRANPPDAPWMDTTVRVICTTPELPLVYSLLRFRPVETARSEPP